jgi:hypothetical protein
MAALVRSLAALALVAVVGAALPDAAEAQEPVHHHPLQYLVAPDAIGLVRLDMAVIRTRGMLDLVAPPVGDATGAEAEKRTAARAVAENASEVLIAMLPGGTDEPPVVAMARGRFGNVTLPPLSGGATEVSYLGFTLRADDGMLGGFIGTQTFVLGDPDGVRAVITRITERAQASGVTDPDLLQLVDDVHLFTAPLAAAVKVNPTLRAELPETLTDAGTVSSAGLELSIAGQNLNLRLAVTYSTPAEAGAFARAATAALRQARRSPEVRQMGVGPLLASIRARARAAVVTVTARVRPADVQALSGLAH